MSISVLPPSRLTKAISYPIDSIRGTKEPPISLSGMDVTKQWAEDKKASTETPTWQACNVHKLDCTEPTSIPANAEWVINSVRYLYTMLYKHHSNCPSELEAEHGGAIHE